MRLLTQDLQHLLLVLSTTQSCHVVGRCGPLLACGIPIRRRFLLDHSVASTDRQSEASPVRYS
jgi:hypothetical protein